MMRSIITVSQKRKPSRSSPPAGMTHSTTNSLPRGDCLAAVSKGCQRFVVTPANEEVGKDICISTGWHRLEGVTPDELASRGQSGCVDRLTCDLCEPRAVEHDTVRLRICLYTLHHHPAIA